MDGRYLTQARELVGNLVFDLNRSAIPTRDELREAEEHAKHLVETIGELRAEDDGGR